MIMMIRIVPLYAALLAVVFVWLSMRIVLLRLRLKITIGDAGSEPMLRAMRVHANFAEYVPFSLILLYLVEGQGGYPIVLHGLGLCLLIGRLVHAFGVSQPKENLSFRTTGMVLTFTTLLGCSAYLLFTYFRTSMA